MKPVYLPTKLIIAVLALIMPFGLMAQDARPTIVVDSFYELCAEGGGFDALNAKAQTLGWQPVSQQMKPVFFGKTFKTPTREAQLSRTIDGGAMEFAYIGEEKGRSILRKRMKLICFTRLAVEDAPSARADFTSRIGKAPSSTTQRSDYTVDMWTNYLGGNFQGFQIHPTEQGYSFVTALIYFGDT